MPHLGWGSGEGVGALGFVGLVGSGLLTLALVVTAVGQRPWRAGALPSAPALTLGLGLALVPWTALAYWLAVATHHRPLGAVTFAVLAIAGALLAVLVAGRTFSVHSKQRAVVVVAEVWAALAAVGLVVIAARGIAMDETLRSAVPDLGLGVVVALLAALVPVAPLMTRLSRWALIGCVCLWGATFGLMRLEPDVRATVKSVPIIAGIVGLAVR